MSSAGEHGQEDPSPARPASSNEEQARQTASSVNAASASPLREAWASMCLCGGQQTTALTNQRDLDA